MTCHLLKRELSQWYMGVVIPAVRALMFTQPHISSSSKSRTGNPKPEKRLAGQEEKRGRERRRGRGGKRKRRGLYRPILLYLFRSGSERQTAETVHDQVKILLWRPWSCTPAEVGGRLGKAAVSVFSAHSWLFHILNPTVILCRIKEWFFMAMQSIG